MFGTFYLFNALLFYAGWLTCVISAAKGLALVAPLATLTLGFIHFYFSPCPKKDILDVFLMMGLGFGIETLLTTYPFITYRLPGEYLLGTVPPWILCIYILFALTINHSLAFLESRILIAAILGVIGGIASYSAGVKLGAAEFSDPLNGPFIIGALWGVAIPAFFLLRRLLIKR